MMPGAGSVGERAHTVCRIEGVECLRHSEEDEEEASLPTLLTLSRKCNGVCAAMGVAFWSAKKGCESLPTFRDPSTSAAGSSDFDRGILIDFDPLGEAISFLEEASTEVWAFFDAGGEVGP